MPRTKEFDPAIALDRAMHLFWRKGYHDTSLDDLVAATGVQRYGLYSSFHTKHDLFLAALDRYEETCMASALADLEDPDAGLPAIRAFFDALVAAADSPEGRYGCLMCNTATELAPHDPEAAARVAVGVQRMTQAFARALANAQQHGELPAGIDIDEHAQFLAGIDLGALVLAKTPFPREAVAACVRVALSTLE